jgi:ABC-type sugar transport system ATPase subunit
VCENKDTTHVQPMLEMRNIVKHFPGVLAVNDVSLELNSGEVLALVGENGAGKSTLIKVLSGASPCDSGELILNGERLHIRTPLAAIQQGITVIYQELNTCETLSIAENTLVGNLPTKGRGILKRVDKKTAIRQSGELLKKLNLNFDPRTPVAKLSIAEKQIVEIAKALSRNTKVLVMDEPTAALNEKEVDLLFDIIRQVKSMGTGIIFISHRLDEIFQVADRVQIMRDGKSVFVGKTDEITKPEIIHHMIGREVDESRFKDDYKTDKVVFEVEGLTTRAVKDISFKVYAGEVLGLFGLMGSGRTNIVKAIFGAERMTSGVIHVAGKETKIKSPSDAKDAGISYIPNDRKLEGLMLNLGIRQNVSITVLEKILGKFGLNKKKEAELVQDWVKQINIKTTNLGKAVESLSGGNQQKVVMAKWLAAEPKVMILNEPTRGVDVGAKREIYNIIVELCKKGMGVIMISSDLPEMLSMADRVVVIHEGANVGEISGGEITQHNLMTKAVGE